MIKLSVIIPVYNIAPYLSECLDSLVASASCVKSSALIELICINDGSTDRSGEILDTYNSRISNPNLIFRIEHKENGGVSSARNRGLEIASGDYLLFVDSDDFVRETFFSDICRLISDNPDCDLISFGMLPFYGGSLVWDENEQMTSCKINIAQIIDNRLPLKSICTFCYKQSLTSDLRFKSFSHGEDIVFMSEVFSRAKTCVITGKKEYVYRFRENSATHKDLSPTHMTTVIRAFTELFTVLAKSGKDPGNGYKRNLALMWLNEQPRFILKRIKKPYWQETWNAWLDSMNIASGIIFFSKWQRFAARVAYASRSPMLVKLLSILPARLLMRLKVRQQ